MKKVFLVRVSFENQGLPCSLDYEVFANRKKADSYCAYKNLLVKRGETSLCKKYDNIVFRVVVMSICTIDWSNDLKALQDETL